MPTSSDLLKYLPSSEGKELIYLTNLTASFSEEQMASFASAYNARRRKPMVMLLLNLLLGLLGAARFYLGQMGMGILYLFTGGILGIGCFIDIFRFKSLNTMRNIEIANEIAASINASMGTAQRGNTVPAAAKIVATAEDNSIPLTQAAPWEMSIRGITGYYANQSLPVGQSSMIIGRDAASCNLVLSSNSVSRRHARLSPGTEPDSVILEDLGSTNGTFVQNNGTWIKISSPVTLTIFKRFRIGDAENEFEIC